MNHTPAAPGPRRRVLRLLTVGVTVGSVVALTAATAHASTDDDHSGDRPDGAYTVLSRPRYRPSLVHAFRTLDDPTDPTFNQLLGINDRGRIVGYFGSGASPDHPNKGYVVKGTPDHPVFRDENFPGSVQTQVVGINSGGTTVGFYVDSRGTNIGFVASGGHFVPIANPATDANAPFNQLLGINRHGVAVGFYNDADGAAHGYTYDTSGDTFAPVQLPVASDSATAAAINDYGDIAGFAASGKTTTGFLLHRGHLERLSFGAGTNTQALGVNNNGRVVGSFIDAAGAMHGFVWSHDRGMAQVDDPLGTGGTLVNGINNTGQLVGFYVDATGNTHGFVARR